MQSRIILQKQLTNNNETYPTSYYKMMKIGAQSNSNPTISSSTSQTTFEIPGGNVINLSRLRISFLRGAVSAGVNTYFQYLYTSFMALIQRIELYSSSNIRLVDVNYVDAYNKVASPCVLNVKHRTKIDGFLYPAINRFLKTPVLFELTSPTVGDDACGNFNPFVPSLSNTAVNPTPIQSIEEPDYIICSVSNANATPLVAETSSFNMLLKDILPDSIFALDQDLFIQKVLYLRITWNSIKNCG